MIYFDYIHVMTDCDIFKYLADCYIICFVIVYIHFVLILYIHFVLVLFIFYLICYLFIYSIHFKRSSVFCIKHFENRKVVAYYQNSSHSVLQILLLQY